MSPEEDPTWPACPEHGVVNLGTPKPVRKHWCDWTLGFLRSNRDADQVAPGLRYCVPVVPSREIYAEVSIDTDWIAGISAKISLVDGDASDPFGTNENLIPIGLWTTGEGRWIITQLLTNWAEENAPEKCEAGTHNFAREVELQQKLKNGGTFSAANAWYLATKKMCIPCWEYTKSRVLPSPPTSAPSPSVNLDPNVFNAAQFGLGPDNFKPSRDGQSARQQKTRDALAQRFGNRSN